MLNVKVNLEKAGSNRENSVCDRGDKELGSCTYRPHYGLFLFSLTCIYTCEPFLQYVDERSDESKKKASASFWIFHGFIYIYLSIKICLKIIL